jgi:hypothetical protein
VDPTQTSHRQAESATEALEELHHLLVAAGEGNVEPREVGAAVKVFWSNHGDMLRTAVSAVTEQVRLQALQELYKWRDQLADQLNPGSLVHHAESEWDQPS